ncbi:hypothetical protein EIP91_000434 [Steccherinum ochraceum]|uniref:Uncharacterized protein n=1 Tax=Steccherinum ochraceum TaxID=92696 RepID=A0A4R0RP99_9APHY|nr:hypothetical protein EIP91_000434 [Steccherinum ochraceum]
MADHISNPSYLGTLFVMPSMVYTQLFSPGTWWMEYGMWHTWQGQAFGIPKEDLMLKEWSSWSKKTPYAVIPFMW